MADPNVLDRMRSDWNERAREDANYYVAFGRREQQDDEFFASAAPTVTVLEAELKRLPGRDAALEIGCGPGRLLKPMSRHFRTVEGVDVSDEMIRLARQKLQDVPNARVHATNGAELSLFAADTFDLVYSYAVFQHIPSREVVFRYLEESRRVLKQDGILHCQINGLPQTAAHYSTWDGVRISAAEVMDFAREHDLQLLALQGDRTQYMWAIMRKRPAGWSRALAWHPNRALLRNINNTLTGEAAVPSAGHMAALALWIEHLPPDCDLNNLAVLADGRPCRLIYLGHPTRDGVCQLNATLPEGTRTGLLTVEVRWLGQPLCRGTARLIPPGPAVPVLCSITDGINLLAPHRTQSGTFKAIIVELDHPERFTAEIGGAPVRDLDTFCTDPVTQRYEFNFHVPEGLPPGPHELVMRIGRRLLPRITVEVA
ncbi:MAG TPA: class I SAM-dependent methyltransferase [Bryobacteraceae bacterium]|nr:class I SAM-dependent methyltransferase [Bryobacteraceae bacterium]